MSLPLSSEEETRYTQIIDAILATADLNTVTRKKIRMGLERALGGKDLGEQKDAIKKLIEERFDAISAVKDSPPPEMPPSSLPPPVADSPPKRPLNGHHKTSRVVDSEDPEEEEEDPEEDDVESYEPAKKKAKREPSTEDADAKLAAKLQAQENLRANSRTTRGGGTSVTKKKQKPKPTKKKKSSKKVNAEDDSEVDGSEEAAPKRKAGGGFQKPFTLSYALAELCGEPQMARTTVVKKLWEHIKANDLQDPKDKRQIRCDEKMFAVFKQAKIDMFQMNKQIGNHLYPVEEE